ncbi:ParA family protein [Streptococcus sp. S784/96/1]|uniref:ParA family protein n=1 Tax=Streptococcus sp. S784/96/1 TaxID=2653499 RepID=UPI001387152E|nr:ParA family protein [Streptococcus sp. S784/96/1]
MKILTVNINKGGPGKTTFAHNFAEYLAKKYRVLLMDFDDSANLTGRYTSDLAEENSITAIFDEKEVTPLTISPNLDLIGSDSGVERLKERQATKRRREYALGKWLAKNEDWLTQRYDYVIIDTENDEGILTINALIVSDVVIGIAEPSKDAAKALVALKRFVADLNDDFSAQARLYFIANRVNFSENASKDFLASLSERDDYLGYLPRRTVLGDDVAVINNPNTPKALLEQVETLFETIKTQLDKEAA